MVFAKELKAARLIRERGVEAVNEVVRLVGVKITLLMLWACHDGDDEAKIEMMKNEGLDVLADLSIISGTAVIHQKDEIIAVFEVKDDVCGEVSTNGQVIPVWRQGGEKPIILFARKPPYKEVLSYLLSEHTKEHWKDWGLREMKMVNGGRTKDLMLEFIGSCEDPRQYVGSLFYSNLSGTEGRVVKCAELTEIPPDNIGAWCRISMSDLP